MTRKTKEFKNLELLAHKQGLVSERDVVKTVAQEWEVKPSTVLHQLRVGMGQRYIKHRAYHRRHGSRLLSYFFVETLSARKWLLFALDRIPDEWVMPTADPVPAAGEESEG